jgi:hypothetical protein
MPAGIVNDAKVVATGIDVSAVHYNTTVFDRDDKCAERWLGKVMGRKGGEVSGLPWVDEAGVGGAVGK